MTVKAKQTRIDSYTPDHHNANKHSERGSAMLEKSLSEVGLGRSIVVDKNGIVIAGNLTQEQAIDQGFDKAIEVETQGDTLVVVRRTDLDLLDDTADHRARRLAFLDNRASELSLTWNPEQIKMDIDAGINLSDIFDPASLKKILNKLEGIPTVARERKAQRSHEELIQKWGMEPGAIFEITSTNSRGTHRVMCGDSRTDLHRLMQGTRADLVVTSPPYGVGKDYEQGGLEQWSELVAAVFAQTKTVCNLHFINLGDRKTSPDDPFELHTFGIMDQMLRGMGFGLVSLRMWNKPATWSQKPYWRHSYKSVDDFEFLGLYATEKPKHVSRLSEGEMNDWGYRGVWNFNSVMSNEVHSAEFPIELPLRAIRLFSDIENVILDPFAGHGTTLEAAEQVSRTCYLMEKEVGYAAEICERFEEYQPRRVAE